MKKLSLLIAFVSNVCFGAEWIPIGSSHGSNLQVDSQSIVSLDKSQKKAWVAYTYDTPQEANPTKRYSKVVYLYIYKCREKESGILREIYYEDIDATRVLATFDTPRGRVEFKDVIPESFNEAAMQFVCAKK